MSSDKKRALDTPVAVLFKTIQEISEALTSHPQATAPVAPLVPHSQHVRDALRAASTHIHVVVVVNGKRLSSTMNEQLRNARDVNGIYMQALLWGRLWSRVVRHGVLAAYDTDGEQMAWAPHTISFDDVNNDVRYVSMLAASVASGSWTLKREWGAFAAGVAAFMRGALTAYPNEYEGKVAPRAQFVASLVDLRTRTCAAVSTDSALKAAIETFRVNHDDADGIKDMKIETDELLERYTRTHMSKLLTVASVLQSTSAKRGGGGRGRGGGGGDGGGDGGQGRGGGGRGRGGGGPRPDVESAAQVTHTGQVLAKNGDSARLVDVFGIEDSTALNGGDRIEGMRLVTSVEIKRCEEEGTVGVVGLSPIGDGGGGVGDDDIGALKPDVGGVVGRLEPGSTPVFISCADDNSKTAFDQGLSEIADDEANAAMTKAKLLFDVAALESTRTTLQGGNPFASFSDEGTLRVLDSGNYNVAYRVDGRSDRKGSDTVVDFLSDFPPTKRLADALTTENTKLQTLIPATMDHENYDDDRVRAHELADANRALLTFKQNSLANGAVLRLPKSSTNVEAADVELVTNIVVQYVHASAFDISVHVAAAIVFPLDHLIDEEEVKRWNAIYFPPDLWEALQSLKDEERAVFKEVIELPLDELKNHSKSFDHLLSTKKTTPTTPQDPVLQAWYDSGGLQGMTLSLELSRPHCQTGGAHTTHVCFVWLSEPGRDSRIAWLAHEFKRFGFVNNEDVDMITTTRQALEQERHVRDEMERFLRETPRDQRKEAEAALTAFGRYNQQTADRFKAAFGGLTPETVVDRNQTFGQFRARAVADLRSPQEKGKPRPLGVLFVVEKMDQPLGSRPPGGQAGKGTLVRALQDSQPNIDVGPTADDVQNRLMAIWSLFARMSSAGVLNLDAHFGNIMLSRDDRGHYFAKLIDFDPNFSSVLSKRHFPSESWKPLFVLNVLMALSTLSVDYGRIELRAALLNARQRDVDGATSEVSPIPATSRSAHFLQLVEEVVADANKRAAETPPEMLGLIDAILMLPWRGGVSNTGVVLPSHFIVGGGHWIVDAANQVAEAELTEVNDHWEWVDPNSEVLKEYFNAKAVHEVENGQRPVLFGSTNIDTPFDTGIDDPALLIKGVAKWLVKKRAQVIPEETIDQRLLVGVLKTLVHTLVVTPIELMVGRWVEAQQRVNQRLGGAPGSLEHVDIDRLQQRMPIGDRKHVLTIAKFFDESTDMRRAATQAFEPRGDDFTVADLLILLVKQVEGNGAASTHDSRPIASSFVSNTQKRSALPPHSLSMLFGYPRPGWF